MLKRPATIALCLFLGACSWWPWGHHVEDAPPPPPAPKTIGVISVLSDHISIIDAATTGWVQHEANYPLTGWKINNMALDQISTWLHKKGFDVRPVSYSGQAFNARLLGGPVGRGGWFDRPRPSFTKIIKANATPNNLDYYLVLVEASGSTSIPDMRGIGMVHFHGKPQVFVLYHAFIIDGKTGQTIDEVHADAEKEHWGEFSAVDGPNTDIPKAAWPQDVRAWPADQQASFKHMIEMELGESLQATLPRLDLPDPTE